MRSSSATAGHLRRISSCPSLYLCCDSLTVQGSIFARLLTNNGQGTFDDCFFLRSTSVIVLQLRSGWLKASVETTSDSFHKGISFSLTWVIDRIVPLGSVYSRHQSINNSFVEVVSSNSVLGGGFLANHSVSVDLLLLSD